MAKINKHPVQYSIFKPNSLIQSDKSELKGLEIAVYNEILNNNHKKTPDTLTYKIPHNIITYDFSKNGSRDFKRIGEALQKRTIYLDKNFVKKYFGEKSPRSIVPFQEVVYNNSHLEVHLGKTFKRVLTMLEIGFTKGDIETLRQFKHDVSSQFYWIARQHQTYKKVWKISLLEFRNLMFITKHKDWRNFKKKVIDSVQEDMKGTWMEFEIELVKKGTGGAVRGLILNFKYGPKEEEEEPIGIKEEWERILLGMRVNRKLIIQIRRWIRNQDIGETDNGEKFIWELAYIEGSIDAARKEYNLKKNDSKRISVKNVSAWFISGLIIGRWLKEANAYKEELTINLVDTFFSSISTKDQKN